MRASAFERTPPAWVRKAEAALLMGTFARAFDVEPPSLRGLSAREALRMFSEFTAACMEMAQEDARVARFVRGRLGAEALELGRKVRLLAPLTLARRLELARYLYRGIGIELNGALPASLRFGPCSFARRYTPGDCWLMSAFDEGFLRGLWACEEAGLVFSCRLTQGAPCCKASFSTKDDREGARR